MREVLIAGLGCVAIGLCGCSEVSEPRDAVRGSLEVGEESASLEDVAAAQDADLGPQAGASAVSEPDTLQSEPESAVVRDPGAPDYTNPMHWFCHPDRLDGPCFENLDLTAVHADGSLEVIPHQKAAQPAFDCFYVYPTCSLDSAPNADLDAVEEAGVVHLQAARFQSMCRLFAPIYRQLTIGGISLLASEADPEMAYGDVADAFNHYLEHYNEGRGVVLIGHSQGTRMLTELMRQRFDNDPELRARLIAAYLIGYTVDVPDGAGVGGAFQTIPLCSAADESGCIITYAAYRALLPPQAGAEFGVSSTPGMEAGCTDPRGLLGDMGPLQAIFPARVPDAFKDLVTGNVSPFADPASAPTIETGFFSVPGLVSGECARLGDYHYLSIAVNADADDPRADDVGGDILLPGWGLHLVDVNLAMGQLETLIGRQAASYHAR